MKIVKTLSAMLATVMFSSGFTFFGLFEDPAIKACRVDLMSSLKSPTSYSEVEVNLYSDPSVFINYDAANGYGALVRGLHHCEWVYFDGAFTFKYPLEDTIDEKVRRMTRWLALLEADLDVIKAGDTEMTPRFPDEAFELCVKATVSDPETFRLSMTSKFSYSVSAPENYQVKVDYRSIDEDDKMPKSAVCVVESGRGENPNKVLNKVSYAW